ncbi:hypothetical protein SAMN02745945_02967 [Peptoclostridium litorale DSM 5388]|uniref:Uncharacterized protein n=1 Tax=Peptoclostridium litorale DSM 5388 TaxID=1121324 RepID=A0A069RIE1_PEPLI|nr:hypothetical protein [Peptoclostridium litorale]KDR96794.1 hypothetical protein CLIT_20p00070 [Peptoclostridium litorale DSM 5388]SIO36641.1 hypothetical protein SAMN02745945_02967 [Peptoclostridium litorale DSM 5388]
MGFEFETISSDEFEKRKELGEFGEVSSVIESKKSPDMMSDEHSSEEGQNEKAADNNKKDYIRQTFLLDKDLKRAIRRKAANEDKGLNEIVRDILRNSIENKYFEAY